MAAARLELPSFPIMIRRFLYDQLYPDSPIPSADLSVAVYPQEYLFSIMQLQCFMHPVMPAALLGCAVNIFERHLL
jgi:hypothetical protein